jgi:Protein of unknown function (DUF1349)
MFDRCVWLNEPREWHLEAGVLSVSTEQETDFWRETHYGFNRDNGHFFNCETNGDFTAELRVQAQYDTRNYMICPEMTMPESKAREVELPRGAIYSTYVLRIRSLCAVTNYQFSGWRDFQSGQTRLSEPGRSARSHL